MKAGRVEGWKGGDGKEGLKGGRVEGRGWEGRLEGWKGEWLKKCPGMPILWKWMLSKSPWYSNLDWTGEKLILIKSNILLSSSV